jgi:hypothetical protein
MSILKGIFAGFVATFILSLGLVAAAGLGWYPHTIRALAMISHHVIDSPMWLWIGWAYHFAIGTLLWGIIFGFIGGLIRVRRAFSTWLYGVIFAICAWVLYMVVIMPLSGLGFFDSSVPGFHAGFTTLIWHFIWGTVLGLTFYALSAPAQVEHETVYERTVERPVYESPPEPPPVEPPPPPPPVEPPPPPPPVEPPPTEPPPTRPYVPPERE